MPSDDLKPTLRPVAVPAVRPVEERVAELERTIALILAAESPVQGEVVGAGAELTIDLRWPTVDELEYFCWVCLAVTAFSLMVKTSPGLLGVLA